MDTEIKICEFDILNDDQPKISRLGNYLSYKQIAEFIDLLKEYQDISMHNYQYLKGLVKQMGEMKINLIPGENPIKKRPYKLAHKYKPIG